MITVDEQRSLSGRAAMLLMRAAAKTVLASARDSTVEAEIAANARLSENNRFTLPKDRRAVYLSADVGGYPCLIMRKKRQVGNSRSAVLYLHGGLQNIWKTEIGIARGYMNRTGCDVWYPIYPSPTEVPITESIRVCCECFRKLEAVYGAENTAIVGSSFGGYYALQILNRLNLSGEGTSMPALVIALSPNGIPELEEERNHMKELAEKDPALSYSAVMMTAEIAKRYDRNAPDYTIYPILLDLRNAPPVYIYYGEETLSGNAACYRRAFEKSGCGDRVHIHIQKGMMHDYACMPVFPESRRAYEEQIRLILNLQKDRNI